MNAQKFTEKSLEAIMLAQNIVIKEQNAQVEQEHILLALLEQENSLIKELLKKMNINVNEFENEVKSKVQSKAKITGAARQANSVYVAQDVDMLLTDSEDIAEKMKDDYVSVEHIFISLLDSQNRDIKELFKKFGITKNDFLKVLAQVRGNTRVTSENPEATYDVLSKYGQDLVQLARKRKS